MDEEAARQIFSAGEYLEQAGKLEQALACYRQAAKLLPQHYHYHYRLGKILCQQNQLEQASQCLERAISLNDRDSWSYYTLGEISSKQGKTSAAIAYYLQAIVLNPDFSWSHYNLASLYQQRQQWKNAKASYQQAIVLNPNFSWSHYNLAEVLTVLKERRGAIEHYQKAIELNPEFEEAYCRLALHLQQEGKLEAAVEHFRQGIKLNRTNFDCYYFLAKTLIQLGRRGEAICCCEAAIELQPNNLLPYYHLSTILLTQEERAIADYQKSALQKPLVFQVNLALGMAQAWEQLGCISNAVESCQKALELDPTAEMPYRIAQYLPIAPTEIDRAIAFYRRLSNRESSPLLWSNLGDLLTKQQRITEAIDCYRQGCYRSAIACNPQLDRYNWQQPEFNSPNFIIVGASKSGTTSLFFYLSQHPQILMPQKKEINFFNHNFGSGISWYLAQFPAIADGKHLFTGEASPLYMCSERARRRIGQLFPDTKIIMMLRNPTQRTVSEYYHAVERHLEKRSLTAIISEEQKLLATQPASSIESFGYLFNSIYVDKIARWQASFPAENILIIESESFFRRTDEIMDQTYQFLGLPAIAQNNKIRYNVGAYPPVGLEIERQLQEFFAPYNQKLTLLLNRTFNWE